MSVVEHGPSIGMHHGKSIPAFIVTDRSGRRVCDRTRAYLPRPPARAIGDEGMKDDPLPPMIEYKSQSDYERERAENFRAAALIGYGALQARNTDGSLERVMKILDRILWPEAAQ